MDKYVIGVDGGGTKTEAILVDRSGTIIAKIRGGSTNYQALGGDRLKKELLSMFQRLLEKSNVASNKLSCVFLGLAGAGRKSDQSAIKALFDDTDFRDKISVDSDAIIALAGAFANGPGIILIAGTGSICFGKNAEGKIVRSGGWGYLLEDEGSGYYIGRKAILAALKDFDGREEQTTLRRALEAKFHLNTIDEIIPMIYQNKIDRVAIAELALLVFEQARNNDAVATLIIKQTGRELGKLAKAVAKKLTFANEKIRVGIIGSVFKQKDLLINEISKELYEISWDIQIMNPEYDPTLGAAFLAFEKSGIAVDENILTNLKKATGIFIE